MPRKDGQTGGLEQVLKDIQTVMRDGERWLRTNADQLKVRARARAQFTDHFVRSYPYRTLCLIFGLGLLAGLWAGTRPSKPLAEGRCSAA